MPSRVLSNKGCSHGVHNADMAPGSDLNKWASGLRFGVRGCAYQLGGVFGATG